MTHKRAWAFAIVGAVLAAAICMVMTLNATHSNQSGSSMEEAASPQVKAAPENDASGRTPGSDLSKEMPSGRAGAAAADRDASNRYPEEVEAVLSRNIYEFKHDNPTFYAAAVDNIDQCVSYVENWTFRQILTDTYFDDIDWTVSGSDANSKIIAFTGSCRLTEQDNTIMVQFLVSESAEVPIALSLYTYSKTDGSASEISANKILEQYANTDSASAIIYADVSISCMLAIMTEDAVLPAVAYSSEPFSDEESRADYKACEVYDLAVKKRYDSTDGGACFKIFDITNNNEVFFEADWYRANGFGGVARLNQGVASFDVQYGDGIAIKGSFVITDDIITLTLDESTLPYVLPGTYQYAFAEALSCDWTLTGEPGILDHTLFLDFLAANGIPSNSEWEYLGTSAEIFLLPDSKYPESGDLYKLLTPDGGETYYMCLLADTQRTCGVCYVDYDGILYLVWNP